MEETHRYRRFRHYRCWANCARERAWYGGHRDGPSPAWRKIAGCVRDTQSECGRVDETYPFRGLCGSGVAWKLVCAALAIAPELREKVPEGWEKWLDMVGLATIADMVPLVDENRVLATYGLKVMRKSPRLGLQKLCRGMRVDQRTMTSDDVGFMIAPRVNAASRIGDAREAFRLFTITDESVADGPAKNWSGQTDNGRPKWVRLRAPCTHA